MTGILRFVFLYLIAVECRNNTQPNQCHCENIEGTSSLTCHCSGSNFDKIPDNATEGAVYALSLSNGGLTIIKKKSLDKYRGELVDLSISWMNELKSIEDGALCNFPKLKSIRILHTALSQLPKMKGLDQTLTIIDLENNNIESVGSNSMVVRTGQLFLNYNNIVKVDGWAFNGSEIGKLSFRGNKELKELSENAFRGLKSLRELDLSGTSITNLPINGLEELESLWLMDTYSLKIIPSIHDFNKLQTARLTYSFHCCAFQYPAKHNPTRHKQYLEDMKIRCEKESGENVRNKRYLTESFGEFINDGENMYPNLANDGKKETFAKEHEHNIMLLSPIGEDSYPHKNSEEMFHDNSAQLLDIVIEANCGNITQRPPVSCRPEPDALNPCEDMMSWSWLRMSVWIVISTAIIGNTSVLTVLSLSRSETSVPRFLMSHLAFADLCMAIYLLLLAIMDLVSKQTYFNYAYDWQQGAGCKVTGFLTVFASQLSLFTLCLLTVERWFAIRHALYTNRLDHWLATKIMIFGWIYALTMATLPLLGISSYSRTSICLPMDTHDGLAIAYVLVLLSAAALGFLLICICYTQIYLSLSYKTRHLNNEGSVAQKMTLLVATNFACWAPIAFFSLTAVAGYPLISVTESKILLVFIYPINSCANPYLYAILTKQYRKDLVLLLSRYGVCNRCAQRYKMVYSRPTSNEVPTPLIAEAAV